MFWWQHQILEDDVPQQDTLVTQALMTGGPRAETEPLDPPDLPIFSPFDIQNLYLPEIKDFMVVE
jgi:hypothetical protein